MIMSNNIDEINTREELQIIRLTCGLAEITEEIGRQHHYNSVHLWC
jgi:hypothetical protein